ncbi:MAG TPA: GFA family protein [Gaiellales bacterium]|jgi:hypothetical protein
MDTPLTGGCGCGAVRYEVTEPLASALYCHCTRCQRRSGTAASANARTAPGAFRITQGADRVRRWVPESGAAKAFCADCGSALYSENATRPDVFAVRLGSFDSDPGIRPQFRQFVAYAAAFEDIPDDGLPRFPERAP